MELEQLRFKLRRKPLDAGNRLPSTEPAPMTLRHRLLVQPRADILCISAPCPYSPLNTRFEQQPRHGPMQELRSASTSSPEWDPCALFLRLSIYLPPPISLSHLSLSPSICLSFSCQQEPNHGAQARHYRSIARRPQSWEREPLAQICRCHAHFRHSPWDPRRRTPASRAAAPASCLPSHGNRESHLCFALWFSHRSELRNRSECEDSYDYARSSTSRIHSSSKRDIRCEKDDLRYQFYYFHIFTLSDLRSVFNLRNEFKDVFHDEPPPGLPPKRGIEHLINFIRGAPLPNKALYRVNPDKTKEIQRR